MLKLTVAGWLEQVSSDTVKGINLSKLVNEF